MFLTDRQIAQTEKTGPLHVNSNADSLVVCLWIKFAKSGKNERIDDDTFNDTEACAH